MLVPPGYQQHNALTTIQLPELIMFSAQPPPQVPEDCALIAGSRVELLGALLVPAHALLQELVAHAAGLSASADPLAQRLSLRHRPLTKISPREMLVLHLMHTVGASPAARLPATESDQVSMLLEMLDGKKATC